MPLLTVRNVHTFYGSLEALHGVDLLVEEGEIVTLIGGNGAGKTTLLNTVSGLLKPRVGTVHFRETRIDTLDAHQIVRMGISQAPEGRRIFRRLTVLENLEMGAFTRRDRREIRRDMDDVFELFPRLQERSRQTAGTLSGGEQQMLAMGRALMARPELVLLDEPSMGLAPVMVETIFRIISDINARGATILLIEQNALLALEIARRGYVMQSGRIVMENSASSLLQDESVRKFYLGEDLPED